MLGFLRCTLRWFSGRLTFFTIFVALFVSCDVPTEVYDNPLDEEAAEEVGIDTPALVFFPDKFEVTAGSSISIQLYALEVIDVAGAHIQLSYDKSLVSVNLINAGDFFSSTSDPVFIYEDDPDAGIIDIYTSFLGADSTTVSGTGNMATLVLGTTTSGQSTISYTAESELVDRNDNPVELKGLGQGEIVAQ
ncbi:MAG: cohesin domain-containing protein [Candidatus Neomarinimicrobiota bacterium]|nr:cohesin domain-containing protein [Candidatus Neomarinimicrobiota bacterium]